MKRSLRLRVLIAVCAFLSCLLFALGFALPKGVFAEETEAKKFELTELQLSKKEGYIFSDRQTPDQMFDLVVVTVTYTEVIPQPDPDAEEPTEPVTPETVTETLTLTGTGATRTAVDSKTTESVTFAYKNKQITATVTPKADYTVAEEVSGDPLDATPEAPKVNGISATYNGNRAYTMTTTPSVNDFEVRWAYNDGMTGVTLTNDLYQIGTDNLFPDQWLNVGEKFNKDIEIILSEKGAATEEANGNKYTTAATVTGITFEAPTDMGKNITGSLTENPPARSESISLDGLFVSITFGSGRNSRTYNVPLKAFGSDCFEIIYYNAEDEEVSQLTTAVVYCGITFNYPGTSLVAIGYPEVTVTAISIAAPKFPTDSLISYFDGVNIDVSGLDFSEQFKTDPPVPEISVTTAGEYEMTGEGDARNILFKKPGVSYTILVKLTEGGDFQWQSPAAPATKVNDYTIEYTVQVNKGNWDLTLSDDFNWTYGESSKTGSVKGDLQGTDQNENQSFAYTPNAPAGIVTGFEYHLEYSTDDGATWGTTAPTNAGKYVVKAVSHETEFYNVATSAGRTVTISPKQISAQDMLKSGITYDRSKSYNGQDMLLSGNANGLERGDTVASLNISVAEGGGTQFPVEYYKDDTGYEVSLTLGNKNYVFTAMPTEWATLDDEAVESCRTDSAHFLIAKREIKYNVSQESFAYGTPKNISANLVNSADSIYLTDPEVQYKVGTTVKYTDRTDIDQWDADAYTVTYTPRYGGTDINEESSLILTPVSVNFTISQAQINANGLVGGASVEYDPAGRSFTVKGTRVSLGGLGKYGKLEDIISGTVSGTRSDFTALNFSLGTADHTVALKNADTYTVTLALKDTKNFVWTGGGSNPTATWTITKAKVDRVTKPTDDLTYNHDERTLTLANWNKDLMTLAVTGKTPNRFDEENGTFTLTNAGDYGFTFTLKDASNYQWNGIEGENESKPISFTFTLKKATAALFEDSASADFNDAAKPSFAVPQALSAASAGGALIADDLSFTYTVKNEKGETVNFTQAVQSAGTYIYTITGFTGSEKDNYQMPAGGTLTFTFTVKSQNLKIPTFSATNELTYNGEDQSVLQFITNYGTENYGNRIVIAIDGTVGNVVKTVKGNEEEYTVYITPATNYKWEVNAGDKHKEDETFLFTVKVLRHGLTVTWTQESLSSVYGSAPAPAYTLDKFGTDAVSINIGYKDKDKNTIASLGANSAAGEYFVYATGLKGDAQNNYELKVNPDTKYTIKKQTIAKPLATGNYQETFGTTESGNLYSNQNSFDQTLLSAEVTGYRPELWFKDTNGNRNLTIDTKNTYFDLATGKFHYVNAGYYTVTFQIKDGANYCWFGEDDSKFDKTEYTHFWTDFAQIARQKLTAPAFGDFRAQEWEKFDPTKLNVDSSIDGVAVTVQYGSRSGSGNNYGYNNDLQSDVMGSATNASIGQYYIYVSVEAKAGVDILNYEWGDSADGVKPFVVGADTKLYGEGGVAIRLHYAITSSQLPLEFEAISYTFGDNGVVNGKTELADFFSALTLRDGFLKNLTNAGMGWNTTDVTFVDGSIKFTSEQEETVELENGLPWNAGSYTVSFIIQFRDSNYQNLPVTDLKVTVAPRQLELNWTKTTKVYDGRSELGTVVEMINVPKRGGVEVARPTLVVKAKEGDTLNAATYTLYVAELTGENADNFIPTEVTSLFTITPYQFTATGIPVTDHVYGEALPQGEGVAWNATTTGDLPDGFANDIKNVVLSLKRDGTVPTKLSVGDYTIQLAWKEGTGGNYSMSFTPAESPDFEIVKREITVTLTGADASNNFTTTYYDNTTNYANTNYANTQAVTNGTGSAIVADDNPFELRSAVTQNSAVNTYPITVKVTDGNYIVTVLGTQYSKADTAADTGYKHVITNATLTPDYTVQGTLTYDADDHAYLEGTPTAEGSNLSANNLQYWIYNAAKDASVPAENAEGWEEYDSATHCGNAATNYYFFIKVTANNHDTVILGKDGKPFCLTIDKATLTGVNGIVSGDSVYTAKSQAYLRDNHTVNVVGGNQKNAPVWKIAVVAAGATVDGVTWNDFNAETHAQKDVGKYYFFVKITAPNHNDLVLTGANGAPYCLNITQATLTLTVNMSIFFNEENPATAGYYMNGGAVTVDKLKDGYNKVFFVKDLLGEDELASLDGLSGSFTYSVNYTKGVSGVGSNYTIAATVTDLTSKNYSFSAGSGTLEVKQLPVSATISAESVCKATYGATGLTMPEAVVTTAQKSTYGAGTVDISNLKDLSKIVTVSTDALIAGEGGYTTNTVQNGGYAIVLTLNGNFKWDENGYVTKYYVIDPAGNQIITPDYSLFADADSWKEGNSEKGAAWVYGSLADDGYKADGKNALKDFALLDFTNPLTITLKYGTTELGKTTVQPNDNIKAALDALFAGVISATDKTFNAGDYTVTYEMDASDNYEKFVEVWNFKVDKRNVTVTPDAVEVVYGEKVDAKYLLAENKYKYTNSDLDGYGEAEAITGIITDFCFATVENGAQKDYTPGWNAKTYQIRVMIDGVLQTYNADGTFEFKTDNYVFTFEQSNFNVTPRTVTVKIKNASNHYMLVGNYDADNSTYEVEKWADLDNNAFDYVGDSMKFFGSDVPFTLHTVALISELKTKDCGEYAIYAQFVDATAKSNYNVVIANEAYASGVDTTVLNDTDENLLIKKDGALYGGVFTVEKAELYAEMIGPFYKNGEEFVAYDDDDEDRGRYDGREKYYFATTNVDREDLKDLLPTFTPSYTQNGQPIAGDAPKNAGTYRVTFTPDGSNSNFTDLRISSGSIVISARRLSVGAQLDNGSISGNSGKATYNGNPFTPKFTFNPIVEGEVLGLKVLVNNKEDDGVVLPSKDNPNQLQFAATQAGTYSILVTLDGEGSNNYSLSGGSYAFELTIEAQKLYAVIQNSTIEYGTPLTENKQFTVAYSLTNDKATETEKSLWDLIERNMNAGKFTNTDEFIYETKNVESGLKYDPKIGAGARYSVNITNLESDNYDVQVISADLTVVPRVIEVNVHGVMSKTTAKDFAHNVYDANDHSTFGSSAFAKDYEAHKGWYLEALGTDPFGESGIETVTKLNIALSIPQGSVNAGEYEITPTDNDPNFEIRFRYNGNTITGENRPLYRIDRKTLTAKVQGAGTSFEASPSTVNVVYGNEAVQSLFTVCFDGWVPGQENLASDRNLVFVIGEDGNRYGAYTSQVGQTYNVTVTGIYAGNGTGKLTNYFVEIENATLAITPRPISAETEFRTFTPDTNDYHGGAWGLPLEAQIAFTGADEQWILKNGYELSYNTKADSLGQTATAAPVKVGDYKVTVSLKPNKIGDGKTYYNYTFSQTNDKVQSVELNYSITKLNVNLVWSDNTVSAIKQVVLNGGFVKDVMNVVSFAVGERALGENEYSATNEGLSIEVGSVNGTYTITVVLKDTAKGNYQLVENTTGTVNPIDQRVTGFTVDLAGNKATVIQFVTTDMGSWTYSEAAKEPKAEVRLSSSSALVDGAVVIFDYVPANAPDGTALDAVYDSTAVGGWFDNTKWTATVSNAGKYLVRARYTGSTEYHAANPVFFYFEIRQKELEKPAINNADGYVYAEQNGVGYIEGRINGFDVAAMQIVSSDVQASMTENGMTIVATGKGNYKITVSLTDKVNRNYVWSDGSTDDVVLNWTVKPATDNIISWNDALAVVGYSDPYTLAASSQKYLYNLRIEYAYTARAEGEENPAAGASWTVGFPVNAGKYWVRAVGSSPEGNYNTHPITKAFEITKATLTLMPSGSMTFGKTFKGDSSMNSYTIHAGLLNNDTEQMIMRDLKNVIYSVENAPASGLWAAGDRYNLKVEAEATNYVIVSLTGKFTVYKERLYVTVGNNASSLYKQPLNLSAANISLRGAVEGDDEAALIALLKEKLVCTATVGSDAGRYEVKLSVTEIDNYTLSVTSGVYTVEQLPVRIVVDWGGYDYGAEEKLPFVTNVFYNNTELDLTEEELKKFRFIYSLTGSATAPTAAGNHVVTVRVDEDSNYKLSDPVSGLLSIRLTELDATLIIWEKVYYDEEIKKPEVEGIVGNEFTADMFEIAYEGDWKHAGEAYEIVLTLKYPESTKWKSVEGAERRLTYTVSRGKNELVGEGIRIENWVYGGYSAEENTPVAKTKFGTVTFEYSDSIDGNYSTAAPVSGNVGKYWVRAVVGETTDWESFASEPVMFEITQKAIAAPTLDIITEGYGQNNVYTGNDMQAEVLDFDSTLMYIRYEDGTMIVNGNRIKVIAKNAGEYHVTITLAYGNNYKWEEGTELDGEGNARLTWTINRKKLARPTHNDATLIVNGQELAYYPIGFDPSIMKIEDNTSGYGGTFKATVSLIDTANYEWADGSTDSVIFEWHVVGADSVFVVVISILSVLVAGAAVAGGVEGFFYYKKKKEERSKADRKSNAKEGV